MEVSGQLHAPATLKDIPRYPLDRMIAVTKGKIPLFPIPGIESLLYSPKPIHYTD